MAASTGNTTWKTPTKLANFIDGHFHTTAHYLDSFDPSDGHVATHVPDSDSNDVERAVRAASAAFPAWSSLSSAERAKYLRRIADALEKRFDEFARAESADQGKPLWLARTREMPRCVENFRFYATMIEAESSDCVADGPAGTLNYVRRKARGVAALIAPWNLPLYLMTWKLAPALASGSTVVVKPSEFTSVSAFMLCKLLAEIGLPNGVVNVVFGLGSTVGEALIRHPDVPTISFTGSTATGQRIATIAAATSKRVSLEMGGKNPAIVFADADLPNAIQQCALSSFLNQGEVCLCTERIYVHRSVFDDFLSGFIKAAKAFQVGHPSDPATKCGALVSAQHRDKIRSYLELAKAEGAEFHCGPDPDSSLSLPPGGYYMAPTIITGIGDESRVMREEIFGPVTCVTPFDTLDEVVRRANDTAYGLNACVFTENVRVAHGVAHRLQVGTVWVNCYLVRELSMPFGGCKQSGVGREGGRGGLHHFQDETVVCVKIN